MIPKLRLPNGIEVVSDEIQNENTIEKTKIKTIASRTYKLKAIMDGKIELAIASNRYSDWCENKNGFRYCRTIYHKTPVRRDIALMVGFEDLRFAEDYKYAVGLKKTGLLKNEIFIDKVLYYYNYKYENPKTKYGL